VVFQRDGFLTGSATFYILRDNGDGTRNGAALPAVALTAVEWDGTTLRFSVPQSDDAAVPFELRLTGQGRAELRRRNASDSDEIVPMFLRK